MAASCSAESFRFSPTRRPRFLGLTPSMPSRRYFCQMVLACCWLMPIVSAVSILVIFLLRQRMTCLRSSYCVWGLSVRASVFVMLTIYVKTHDMSTYITYYQHVILLFNSKAPPIRCFGCLTTEQIIFANLIMARVVYVSLSQDLRFATTI